MKQLCLVLCVLAALPLLADEWLRTVQIATERPDDGQQIINLRITPNKTVEYDLLQIECVYRQKFPWPNEQGQTVMRTLEPVAFIYRRPSVKMVEELDLNLSFRAPISYARLAEAFGAATFRTNAPIVIDRLRIIGERGDARLWQQELKVPGKYEIKARPPQPPTPPPPKGKFGEIDLD
jgi:hypothetical protein